MKITILCSSPEHPVNSRLKAWSARQAARHDVALVRRIEEARGGDILFLISCTEIVRADDRARYGATLVIHASDLPRGRGWSPHVWQILEGRDEIVVTLLDAADAVDTGDIWHQERCPIPRTALWDEINDRIFDAELRLMDWAVDNLPTAIPRPQDAAIAPSYYPRRSPADGAINPDTTFAQAFDAIRVADPVRFPAHVRIRGRTYAIELRRLEDE
ncbi:formyltransferase family protein [uncultured Sulfitobacter sp.]|uniref:formyltransferase family protein n=1 Tax=uncultured Sulfitobacter sp. TaxID=191468 RepID=UPI00260A4516|nr:formyltransferase family protein [uncultured Sulfitobacter sp.]